MTNLTQKKEHIFTQHFFFPKWYSIFINPYFISRRSLLVSIRKFAQATSADATVLDVGCGIKPYRQFFTTKNYTGIDIQGGGHRDEAKDVTLYFDGHTIPFPDNSFDTLLCTEVLEHADDPEMLVAECARVLKSGGRAYFSIPFVYPEHEVPYDFRRFTHFEHQRLFSKNNFLDIQTVKTTGFFGTFGQIFSVWVFEGIPFRSTLLKTLLAALILAPVQAFSLLLDKVTGGSGITLNYISEMKK
jgi:SAM-dependent methyltransferase